MAGFPQELTAALEALLAGENAAQLARDAQAISENYRLRTGQGSRLLTKESEAAAYAAARMPATFAAAQAALHAGWESEWRADGCLARDETADVVLVDSCAVTAQAVSDAFRYDRLVLASATYNADVFPFMRTYIHHLTERGFRNLYGTRLHKGETEGKETAVFFSRFPSPAILGKLLHESPIRP